MPKFNRKYKLTIYPPAKSISVDSSGKFSFVDTTYLETIQIEDPLTLEFHVHFRPFASVANGRIKIYNLNSRHRDSIYKDRWMKPIFRQIKLEAGYDGYPLSTVINGMIREAKSYKREGELNFVTEIDCYDYACFALMNSVSNFTKAPGSTKNDVIRNLISDLARYSGVELGRVGNFEGSYPRGRVFAAYPTWNALKTETLGNCFVQNGKVYCLNPNEVFEESVTVLSSDSGLLSTPQRSQLFVEITTLFEPNIRIGQKVLLQSRAYPKWNGDYKVMEIVHQGNISGAVNGTARTRLGLLNQENLFRTVLPETNKTVEALT